MSTMPSIKNKVIVACAGSGKTTYIVDEALKLRNKRILLTTYTVENLDQIKAYFIEKKGCVPSNVSIQTWFSFLFQDGARPYQNYMTDRGRVQSINFLEPGKALRYVPETEDSHYLTEKNYLYKDKVSKFTCKCDEKSNGLVIRRLAKIYDYIFIDELQDFAGWDLNLLEELFKSGIVIIAVGDPRQATFSTNNSSKNNQYRKSDVYLWLKKREKTKNIIIEEKADCYRCNQQICNFSDDLFPDLSKTKSMNNFVTGHDGIYWMEQGNVNEYISKYKPTVLRFSKATKTMDLSAINIGLSKGRTYDRVLIFATNPMQKYLETADLTKAGDKIKLYIAVTRARYSAAFVVSDGKSIKNNLSQAWLC